MQTPNSALAIIEKMPQEKMPDFSKKITLALDGIQDPGNMGAIIRSADWFGVNQIIATHDTADKYNPKVVQASMGSIARVQVWYGNLNIFLDKTSVPVYGATMQGKSIYHQEKIEEGILIIGNEGNGIRKELLPKIQFPITIPAFGSAESLNASVATGIMLSHLRMSELFQ
jgi:TrmH family RNA methyltransferase